MFVIMHKTARVVRAIVRTCYSCSVWSCLSEKCQNSLIKLSLKLPHMLGPPRIFWLDIDLPLLIRKCNWSGHLITGFVLKNITSAEFFFLLPKQLIPNWRFDNWNDNTSVELYFTLLIIIWQDKISFLFAHGSLLLMICCILKLLNIS